MKRLLLVAVVLETLLQAAGAGAISSLAYDDPNSPTVEPMLTRSSIFEVDANRPCPLTGIGLPTSAGGNHCSFNSTDNGSADLTHLDVTLGNGVITAHIGVKTPFVTDATQLPNILPYSGQHVLVMFQSKLFEANQVIGPDLATWGPPGYNADNFHWFLYYGWTLSENRTVCGMGYYDPTGELLPPAPVIFGQTFFVLGQNNSTYIYKLNTRCSLTNGGKTITFVQPYTYTYQDATGTTPLKVKILDLTNPIALGCVVLPATQRCDTIFNVSAFAWLDHEVGAPDPVGLIMNVKWYADSLPKDAYSLGLIDGDPNPNQVAGPDCYLNYIGVNPTGGRPGPCMIPNPIGPGFRRGVGPVLQATS